MDAIPIDIYLALSQPTARLRPMYPHPSPARARIVWTLCYQREYSCYTRRPSFPPAPPPGDDSISIVVWLKYGINLYALASIIRSIGFLHLFSLRTADNIHVLSITKYISKSSQSNQPRNTIFVGLRITVM